MKKYKWWDEDAPVNATGTNVVGTGDDDSTVVIKKKVKVYRRKRKMSEKEIEEARNYRKEYDDYHAKPEQRERNAARLRARRQMVKDGKVKKFDKKDVHHKDNNPLNNEDDNLAVTTQNWNRSEPRLRQEARFMELPDGKKIDITKLSLSQLNKLKGKKGLFKVDGNKLIPRKNIKNWKKKADDAFGNYMGYNEEVEESINILERELTPNELKRREEIAQDLNDADFKKRYGDRWKEVKMGVATNLAKKESINEQDPKADKLKAKELKVAKAIAQAQLAIAKEQERVQKLTDLQNKLKDQATEETTMSKKYFKTKPGSLEESVYTVWQPTTEQVPEEEPATEEEVQLKRVDGRTKQYKETLRRIQLRKERLKKEEIEEGFSSSLVKKAVKIAADMGGDMTGAVKVIEKLKKGLSKDSAVADALQDANEETIREGTKEEYQKFFKAALKKFGAKSPAEMDDEKKKKFFDYIEKNWTKDEMKEFEMKEFSEGELPPALKKAIAAKKAKSKGKEDEDEDEEVSEGWGAVAKAADELMQKSKDRDEKEKYKKLASWIKKQKEEVDVSEGELPPALKKAIAAKKAKSKGKEDDDEDEDKDPVGEELIVAAAIDDLRKIVKTKSMGKVSGTKVDLFSASAMVKVFDALNSKNQAKVEKMLKDKRGVATFQDFAFSQVK